MQARNDDKLVLQQQLTVSQHLL